MNKTVINNEKIARYMGVRMLGRYYNIPEHCELKRTLYSYGCDDVDVFTGKELQYHKSWDWLVPVINRIISDKRYSDYPHLFVVDVRSLETTYNIVVKFIDWYNNKESKH